MLLALVLECEMLKSVIKVLPIFITGAVFCMWFLGGDFYCYKGDFSCYLYNSVFLSIVGFIILSVIKKKAYIAVLLSFILLLHFAYSGRFVTSFKVGACTELGGCWDYSHNKCEKHDQGKCVRTADDCKAKFEGIWNEEKLICKIP